MQRIGGLRRKSRSKLRKPYRAKGKTPLRNYLRTFNEGDKVVFAADPVMQAGMYNLRFHGKIGTVAGKQGSCYNVTLKDGGKEKTFLVHPVHLKRAK